jgi:iron complex outermembrane receptor protein
LGALLAGSAAFHPASGYRRADPDPLNPGAGRLAPLGEVESEGIELDITADITDSWVITLAYAYNDIKVTEDAVGDGSGLGSNALDNGEFANAPEHQLGLWTRYELPFWDLAVAVGADIIDDRVGLGGQDVPSYEVFDASLFWEPGPVSVMLRIDNLTDEEFVSSGFFDVGNNIPDVFGPTQAIFNFPGQSRSYFLEVTKSW